MVVVAILQKGISPDPIIMHLVRCLLFFAALFRFHVCACHIAGAANVGADALSRNNIPLFCSFFSTDSLHSSSPSIGRIYSCPDTRLGLRELDESVQGLLVNGIAPSTRRSYRFDEQCYRNFCSSFRLTPSPLTEATFCHFVVHLHLLPVKYRTR